MAEHDEWARDRNELDERAEADRRREDGLTILRRKFSIPLTELTPEQIEDANALAKELQQKMNEHTKRTLMGPFTPRQVPLAAEELDRIVSEFRALYRPEDELGCLIVDPWMEGEPMILTHEAAEPWIRTLFGDSAEQIIAFRKRHLPRLAVVTPRETWERFRIGLLKEQSAEEARSVFAPRTAAWPTSFGGAPIYTVEQPPVLPSESGWFDDRVWPFLPHNPSTLLRKMEEHRAKHTDVPEDER